MRQEIIVFSPVGNAGQVKRQILRLLCVLRALAVHSCRSSVLDLAFHKGANTMNKRMTKPLSSFTAAFLRPGTETRAGFSCMQTAAYGKRTKYSYFQTLAKSKLLQSRFLPLLSGGLRRGTGRPAIRKGDRHGGIAIGQ
ncbi:MAG: hypothetical protein CVU64_20875 [Deltaproteobacteria bacterium HGW-Deltaproteobacteria-21]|nr:MAG: hypothetical protein CVU64_20875 [Deltaproteobacteria bacterium HGW-Deltaproteobacteria-21]